jgi:hypothetical protein
MQLPPQLSVSLPNPVEISLGDGSGDLVVCASEVRAGWSAAAAATATGTKPAATPQPSQRPRGGVLASVQRRGMQVSVSVPAVRIAVHAPGGDTATLTLDRLRGSVESGMVSFSLSSVAVVVGPGDGLGSIGLCRVLRENKTHVCVHVCVCVVEKCLR